MYPGETPKGFRRQLYSSLAHGAKFVNIWTLFDEDDAAGGATSGWPGCFVSAVPDAGHGYAAMYKTLRRSFVELGRFDDIIRWGRPAQAKARIALLFSESNQIWHPLSMARLYNETASVGRYGTFTSAQHALYLALLHTGFPFDIVIEEDAVDGNLHQYNVLYVADPHVRGDAAAAIGAWVRQGGVLFATAGAGRKNEFNVTNAAMSQLLGKPASLFTGTRGLNNTIDYLKQDLPWAEQLDTVTLKGSATPLEVFGEKETLHVTATDGATVLGTYSDGSPAAIRRKHGEGAVIKCGFHPGLSYLRPAIPRRVVDRGTNDDSFNQ